MANPVAFLKSITQSVSDPLDEIWNGPGIDRQSVVNNFGLEIAIEAGKKMPFLLKRKGGLPIDVAAADYGFASDDALMKCILAYIPKKKRYETWQKDYEAFLSTEHAPPPF